MLIINRNENDLLFHVRQGFEQGQIDALLHQIELGIKHQDENFGLKIILGLIFSWIHGADPIDALQATKYLERFRTEIQANPKLLQDLVEKYFLVRETKTTNFDFVCFSIRLEKQS